MNRIILIGNGFDLAHGLKTSYKDFIDDFWKKITKKIFDSGTYVDDNIIARKHSDHAISRRYANHPYDESIKLEDYTKYGIDLTYKNKFLQKITEKTYLQNWVDIENEYYKSLLDLITPKVDFSIPPHKEKYTIQKLNQEFEAIQNALEEYLTMIERRDLYNSYIEDEMFSSIHPKELSQQGLDELVNSKMISKNFKEKLTTDAFLNYIGENYPKNILFLNFNYTSLEEIYVNKNDWGDIPIKVIHIHGILNNKIDNKIIFGYGDEIDESYKKLENLNDNNYLQNVKSMKYLESKSYKEMLDFINSDTYQVFIFGHSCGISDRTLLNTIFEHSNCQSIKPYYKKSEIEDNYSNIIRDISRNFTNKASMRDKVVNKTYTKPLNG